MQGGKLTAEDEAKILSTWTKNFDGTYTKEFRTDTTYEDAMADWKDIVPLKRGGMFSCWDPRPDNKTLNTDTTFKAQYETPADSAFAKTSDNTTRALIGLTMIIVCGAVLLRRKFN